MQKEKAQKNTAMTDHRIPQDTSRKKPGLLEQIVRFGIVGVISTVVDFVIYTVLCNVVGVPYLIAGVCGFGISLVVNYVLSMRYVFARRDNLSRTREFLLFAGLSLIGLLLNEAILYLCIDLIYQRWLWLSGWLPLSWANVGAKAAATGIVMVYNFISRKIVLERKA